jgi:hypothetical protein
VAASRRDALAGPRRVHEHDRSAGLRDRDDRRGGRVRLRGAWRPPGAAGGPARVGHRAGEPGVPAESFGTPSADPYLAKTLPRMGRCWRTTTGSDRPARPTTSRRSLSAGPVPGYAGRLPGLDAVSRRCCMPRDPRPPGPVHRLAAPGSQRRAPCCAGCRARPDPCPAGRVSRLIPPFPVSAGTTSLAAGIAAGRCRGGCRPRRTPRPRRGFPVRQGAGQPVPAATQGFQGLLVAFVYGQQAASRTSGRSGQGRCIPLPCAPCDYRCDVRYSQFCT